MFWNAEYTLRYYLGILTKTFFVYIIHNDLPSYIKSEMEQFANNVKLPVGSLLKEITEINQNELSYWKDI